MTSDAQQIISNDTAPKLTEMGIKRLEIDARKNWDIFYKQNTTNFYKDRHYLAREFTELSSKLEQVKKSGETDQVTLLDLGCGVGNAFWPLVETFGMPTLRIQCCDFSQRAVNFVKENELWQGEFIDAKPCDLVNEEIPFEPLTANFAQLIFVLSAITPEQHKAVARKIYNQLKPGAILYFRDYGRYDLAQLRFASKKVSKLSENFYVRNDKTRAYYFLEEQVKDIFCNFDDGVEGTESGSSAGFECIECENHYRVVENRKDNKTMHRVWIQAKFRKPDGSTKVEETKVDSVAAQAEPEKRQKTEEQWQTLDRFF